MSFGQLHEPNDARANDISLIHPDPARSRKMGAGTSSCGAPSGLRLRTLSNGVASVDEEPVGKASTFGCAATR